jgi:fatty acid kinase fatty acid binding subunit
MEIVTDSAADLAPEQKTGLNIHVAPLRLELAGKSYLCGVDLQPEEFYALLEETGEFPTTSQPSAGDFADLYRRLAKTDPEILSIHISSGLSGTLATAQAGAEMTPEARVTFFDSKTLSVPLGWMVQSAARTVQAGWSKERILEHLGLMQQRTQGLFTLSSLKYLIHGGRVSHLKGLVASVLNIKPIIGPEKAFGRYETYGQERTLQRAIGRIPDVVAKLFPGVSNLRVQILHGQNPEGVEILRQAINNAFSCQFEPVTVIAPALGAHTGPSIIGLAAGDAAVFEGLL